jgi:L-alanine-DL-glutamate epimerase-like enolase superfamily enzyme
MPTNEKYKIKTVKTFSENLELTRPYTIAYDTFDSVENIFIQIETGGGILGIGAGSPAAFVTGETMESAKEQLQQMEAFLLGADLRKMNGILRRLASLLPDNPSVRAAVDIALHDAYTKMLGIPLVDLWGRAHTQMPTSVTIGIKSVAESIEEAQEYMDSGFKVIKLKTGKTVEEDVEVFSKIRETVGKDIKIRVDANQGYTVQDTIRFYELTKKLGLELMEQPMPYGKVGQMIELPEEIRQISMADENLKITTNALELAQKPHLFGLYNIKLMKCGGVAAGNQIASIANLAGINLMWGCMDESIISITAALHAAFANPNTQYIDLDGSLDLAKDVVKGGFILEDGIMRLNDASGLGVELL